MMERSANEPVSALAGSPAPARSWSVSEASARSGSATHPVDGRPMAIPGEAVSVGGNGHELATVTGGTAAVGSVAEGPVNGESVMASALPFKTEPKSNDEPRYRHEE